MAFSFRLQRSAVNNPCTICPRPDLLNLGQSWGHTAKFLPSDVFSRVYEDNQPFVFNMFILPSNKIHFPKFPFSSLKSNSTHASLAPVSHSMCPHLHQYLGVSLGG